MAFRFQWDPAKAEANRRKHGVTFEEAASAFADLLSVTIPDPKHSAEEPRFLLVGLTDQHRLVVVAHTERGDNIRLISVASRSSASARPMKKSSRKGSSRARSKNARRSALDEMLPEYNFSGGVRGKYARRFRDGTNLILLEPDLAERFPDSVAVNRALRALVEIADAPKADRTRRRTA
jgi:hypothetical protein